MRKKIPNPSISGIQNNVYTIVIASANKANVNSKTLGPHNICSILTHSSAVYICFCLLHLLC